MGRSAARFIDGPVRPVRILLFDKTGDLNWGVPWHQDRVIAVKRRNDHPGYGPWSVKGGVDHVMPPVDILQNLLTLRLHFDPTPADNGALHVLAGSADQGIVPQDRIADHVDRGRIVTCEAMPGDILVLRTLILHASAKSTSPARRRVLHIDYSSADLPDGLDWAVEVNF